MPAPEVLMHDVSSWHLDALLQVDTVAWDIETTGLNWRTESIATCQLHAPGVGTLIVQLRGEAPPVRLCRLLADVRVKKIFHHAPFDLRFMHHWWKVIPSNIVCTKVASRLLDPFGEASAHTLRSLLGRVLGVEISKEQRLSDWRAPDLSPAQLAYAAADVEYLIPLRDELCSRLASSGLIEIFADCCAFLPAHVQLQVREWPDVFAH
jgi:ribonuclease D